MQKRCIALVLCLLSLLTLAGCGGNSVPKVKTVTSNGVECYRVDDIRYPTVFGEPQLTAKELTDLLDGGDPLEMAQTVNTVPDALRLLRLRQQRPMTADSGHAEGTLTAGSYQAPAWSEAMLYLLAGDYDELGAIDLYSSNDWTTAAVVKTGGVYYAFVPANLRSSDGWIPFSGLDYASEDIQVIIDELVEHCTYWPAEYGTYRVSTYQILSKETTAWMKAFTQGEYSDEEIQHLAGAGLTLEEAADKLHTAEDAIRFLKASGYDPTKNNETPGAYFDDIWWLWGMPADCAYGKMGGSCRGTSNVMNHLLAGDYDEQGYVTYLGLHTFNYIKLDGVYYFCDFLRYITDGTDAGYLLYACEDPHDFAEYYYTTAFPAEWNDPSDPNYLAYMYLYPRDGQNDLCIGYRDGLENTYFNLVPAEVRDTLIPLYVRDGVQPLEFIDFDSDANIPEITAVVIDGEWYTIRWRTGEIIE